MGFREDFEQFRKPEEQKSSTKLLPSFEDVRTTLRKIQSSPEAETIPVEDRDKRNLQKLQEELTKGASLSAPKGNEKPLTEGVRILRDKSTDKVGFKMSDLVIPEIRKGFEEAFGKGEATMSSDIYTEMIPSFGKQRAYEIADAYQSGVDTSGYPVGVQLTDIEKKQFDGWKQKHWALIALDASDLMGVGLAVKGGLSFISRTGLRQAVSTASKMNNIKEVHEILLKELPDLKGSQELDDITNIVVAAREQNPDKLAQVIQKRVQDTEFTPRAEFATEAQKVVYENGVPVLRQTTPNTLFERRIATMEAVKGNSEALRLSNADILAEEIRAGALPLKTTADDTIPVWRIAPQGRRIRNGEEVSLVEDFAKSLTEGGKLEKIEVPLADLIRLPDGTFTFAPERLITEAPVLKFPKNIAPKVVDATKKKEADIVAKKLAKDKAEKEAKREATAKAERDLMRPVEEAKARMKILSEKPTKIKVEAQKKIIKEQNVSLKEVASIKKALVKQSAEIDKTLRKAKQAESLIHTKKMSAAKTKLQKQKEKIQYQNKLAKLTEKAKKEKAALKLSERESIVGIKTKTSERVSSLKKQRDDALKTANKELKNTKGETTAILKKTVTKENKSTTVVDKVIDIAKNSLKNNDNGSREKSLKYLRENPEEVKNGEVRLREIEDGVIVIEDGRHRLQVASELGIKPKIVDVTAEYTGKNSSKIAKLIDESSQKVSTVKRGKESLKPVGEGAVRESKLYESTQERVREVRKDLGETINSKEYEFYRTASNKDQLAKATAYIDANGVENTIKILETALRTGGDAVEGVLNNSLLLALEPELLKSGMAKYADNLLRLSSRLSTRMGQELQILSVLDRNNPLSVLARLQSNVDNLVGDIAGEGTIRKGARTGARKKVDELVSKVDIQEGVKKAVDDIIC